MNAPETTSFQRDLLKICEDARLHRKAERDRRQRFLADWDAIRGKIARPSLILLLEPLRAFSEDCGGSFVECLNGGVRLTTKVNGKIAEISFMPDVDLWYVAFDASAFPELRETFTLDALTQEAVEFKLLRFFQEAFGV
jgi:hypothetical protein